MAVYYNEFDEKAAATLIELMRAGIIPEGAVDTRSIEDVEPRDLIGFTQHHFFAGFGVWPYALRAAGWPDDRQVWTGSCPCQPFSVAGKRKGTSDSRHLWPAFRHLINIYEPSVVFGEQVASKDGRAWLDSVQSDMEALGFAFGAADLCAAGVGAPHIRQRLYWVGHSEREGLSERERDGEAASVGGACFGRVADMQGERRGVRDPENQRPADREVNTFADDSKGHIVKPRQPAADLAAGPTNGFWGAADWLSCRDGKWRPVEPGTSPLADGAPERVGRLRGYGNAIVAQVAEVFIRAYMDTRGGEVVR